MAKFISPLEWSGNEYSLTTNSYTQYFASVKLDDNKGKAISYFSEFFFIMEFQLKSKQNMGHNLMVKNSTDVHRFSKYKYKCHQAQWKK